MPAAFSVERLDDFQAGTTCNACASLVNAATSALFEGIDTVNKNVLHQRHCTAEYENTSETSTVSKLIH